MPALRLPAAALLFSIAAVSGSANAQNASLRLTWTPSGGSPKTCVFTADSTGVNMDGNGALTATGSFATADCPSGGGGGVSDPVITNGLDATDLPSPTSVGTSTTVTWAATADSCAYNNVFPSGATVANWPSTGTACANASDCAQTHTTPITYPAIAGSYQFGLTCTKAGAANPATTTRTVTVNSVGGGETCVAPSGLSRTTSLYVEYNAGPSTGRTVDGTKFEEVFGHNTSGSTRFFPGTSNLNQRLFIPRNSYVSLKFTVPSNLPAQTYGMFRFEETQPQTSPARMSMTISKSCGDFATTATAPLTNRCVLNDANVTSNNNFMWGYYPGNASMCQLVPGETYYLNIVHAGLSAPTTSYCAAGSCGNVVQNQKGGGSGWPTVIGGDTE
ncbi:hypothetical protein DFR29_101393 [Tahibacter aquaticus]|uniref:Ig-like domain-containing protein n=1 Tax=Tahibacter aquaticus TaxID=520092 RepID=A0A4R6ZAN6_9GAMM|nr:hypothetical protein [Tahibacter aquaticus]TDR48769.1 hypothetical protein DFR29_101393 [Tahibacter aquaticus]